MSDVRQAVLFFGPGLCHPSFTRHRLYDQVTAAFRAPMVGWLPRQAMDASKRILGVITAFTRQWPHSVPFRPGGATCPLGIEQLNQARAAVDDFAAWYAPTILGGPLEQWSRSTRPSSSVSGSSGTRPVCSACTPASLLTRWASIRSATARPICSQPACTATPWRPGVR